MSLNLIAFQMNEFQSSVDSIENKFDAIFNAVRETLHDLNNGEIFFYKTNGINTSFSYIFIQTKYFY